MWQALGLESSDETYCKSRKSIVRTIGSFFPCKGQARVKVQLGEQKKLARSLDSELNRVGLDTEESGLGLASWFKTPRRVMASAANLLTLEGIAEHHDDEEHMSDVDHNDDVFSNDETESEAGNERTRIQALEDELAILKAQMAQLSLEQMQKSESNVPAAPPPPLAPPPPPTKTAHYQDHTDLKTPLRTETVSQIDDRPDMSFLLREMSAVKLRSVARSPGGTPLRTKSQNTSVPADGDPAAIIARALQKKFSHSVFQDSPDKENSNPGTPHSSVTSPLSVQ
ncbi:mitochondrial fission regulator 2-like isoform X1 [Dysidea avara]|uniref:mitochondrial fission regulator 2-like isoform X1 n=1 Tax=Dysidea avara TaxID=196820 RepID=UPI0033303702